MDFIGYKSFWSGRLMSPVLPITSLDEVAERFFNFSLITTVGTPQCIAAQELRVEYMFPS
jgi:hypothetical protein